jgi:aldose 1-epimerase
MESQMAYQVRTDRRSVRGEQDGTIYILEEGSGACRAEIWPALGFNCYHWQLRRTPGRMLQLLYADPQLFDNGRPTRSGIPILFPFPNRIRDGRFTWQGKSYELPLNDSSAKNAIHGFPCRKPWRVVQQGSDASQAWLTGEFRGSFEAPETLDLWPADYLIRITYRLRADALRLEAQVEIPGQAALPFGLGYHPYFHLPFAEAGTADACEIKVPADSYWELQDSLPSGHRKPVDPARDLRTPRRVGELNLDDVLTDLPRYSGDELCLRATLRDPAALAELRLFCSPAFREMVLFTPVHRQAICVEPYTCTTDAINLQQRGVNAGLLVLQPGESWSGVVEMVVA